MQKMKLNIQLFASSGTIGSLSGSYKTAYTVTWALLNQNISTNKSKIRLYGTLTTGNTTYIGSWYNADKFTINGTKVHGGWEKPAGTSGTVTVWQEYIDIEVEHNPDGTFPARTVTFTAYDHVAFTTEKSGSGTIPYRAVPDIPRQANISTAQDFNDEGNPTITYENKAGNSVTSLQACISLTGSVDDIKYRDVPKTGTLSYTFELTDEERKVLRQATTSNSRKLFFYLRTIIGSNTFYSRSEQTFTIINADPDFPNFEFKDINEKTVVLTGSDQDVILGYSQVQVTIPVTSKAVAKKEATMVNYRFNNNTVDYSDTEDVVIPASIVNSGEIEVNATDSRQNTTKKIKSAVNVINYTPLRKNNITAKRQNGVSESTVLTFSGIIDLVNFGLVENSIKTSKYRYSIAGKEEWSDYFDIVLTLDENGNFSFNNLISGDIENVGFDIKNAYDIEVFVEDELSDVTFKTTLGSGTPHIAYAKNGVGIMGKYDESVGGLLQVGGQRIDNMAGGGDSLPVGAIVEYDGETIPDGYEKINDNSALGLTITDKTYSLGSWSAIDITADFAELFKNNDGIIFKDGKIKISEDATFKYIDLMIYMKWLIPWTGSSSLGNRGVYLYKNGTRIYQEFITCAYGGQSWYGDTYSWLLPVEPNDYFTIAIVRGGTSSSLETNIEHGHIKASAIF